MLNLLTGQNVEPVLLPGAFHIGDVWFFKAMWQRQREHLENMWANHGTGEHLLPGGMADNVLLMLRQTCHMCRVLEATVEAAYGPHIEAEMAIPDKRGAHNGRHLAVTGRTPKKVVHIRRAPGTTITAPQVKRKRGRPRKGERI